MLTAHHLTKSYLIEPVLKNISFSLNYGDRVGLIGPNGCGKSTLLRILAGWEPPDMGIVVNNVPDLRIGYLQQGFEPEPDFTIASMLHPASDAPGKYEQEIARLATRLAIDPYNGALQQEYDNALAALKLASERLPPPAVLKAFGLLEIPPGQLVCTLSGGQKTRLALAQILLSDPNLLLLDEPTNHLDIQMLEWLEDWLGRFPGAALIVSHDRTFLDHTVNRILDLDAKAHTIREFQGNYTEYIQRYLDEREQHWAEYRDQEYEIRRMKQDIAHTKQQAKQVELSTTPRQPGVRRYAKKVARKAVSREHKLQRYLESDERVDKPGESWQMKLEFDRPAHLAHKVIALEDLSVGYLGSEPLIQHIEVVIQSGMRIALVGANGCGKTTLLRTMAGLLESLAGKVSLGSGTRLGYMSQEQELLDANKTALQIIQEAAPFSNTDARSFLHYYLFTGDDPLRRVNTLSYGERARLSLAVLVAQGSNFLLLDEPINHLDIPSRARFEQALGQFDGTVLAVVHDRYFIEHFANQVWEIRQARLFFK